MHKIDGAYHVGNTFVQEQVDTSTPPTEVTDEWLNAVQFELVNVIEAAGIALNKAQNNQLLQALRSMQGSLSGYRVINSATVLTVADAGSVIVPIAAGYTITMPLASTCRAGTIIKIYGFTTGNLTVARQGADNFSLGDLSTYTSANLSVGGSMTFVSDGVSLWTLIDGSESLKYSSGIFASNTQAWQSFTSPTRQINTNYTNLSGRAIAVQCGCTPSGAIGYYTLYVNGIQVAYANSPAGNAFSLYAIVPAGAIYTFSKGGGDTLTNLTWNELR